MSVSNKIRALLNLKDMKPQDLSTCLGISVQAVRNKFTRDSFSVADLIKIASYLDCELLFKLNESQKIELSQEDLKAPTGTHEVPRIPTETAVDSIPQTVVHAEPEPAAPTKPEKHYRSFTDADAKLVDLLELPTNVKYQLEIGETFGMDVLATLLEKARQQEQTETVG